MANDNQQNECPSRSESNKDPDSANSGVICDHDALTSAQLEGYIPNAASTKHGEVSSDQETHNPCKVFVPGSAGYLDVERKAMEALSPPGERIVKIEKVNQTWLVRFLPVRQGEKTEWWVCLGQHSFNEERISCPRCVRTDFVGDRNAPCPVCALAETFRAADNRKISSFGLKLGATTVYLTHCLVYQIDPGRGETQDMSPEEILKPWRFYHHTDSFWELMNCFVSGRTPSRPLSILDPVKGNDFFATRTPEGIHLFPMLPGPIFDSSDPHYGAKMDAIWNHIGQPEIKMPSLQELEAFAEKAKAAAGRKASRRA